MQTLVDLVPASLLPVLLALPGTLVAFLFLLGARIADREIRALGRVVPCPLQAELTVIIPARNESERIEHTLSALLSDPSKALSVVVFDDASTDDTAAKVERLAKKDARLRLCRSSDLANDEMPRDGFGKPIALARAVAASGVKNQALLFLDADVALQPGALGGMLALLEQEQADCLSGAPRLICESAIEAMLVPAFVSAVSSRYRPTRVHDQERPDAFLNGQLILIREEALSAVGGWAAVRHTVLEDVALARRLKAAKRRLCLADLRNVAATRMYRSWSEIRQGFGKNAVPLHGGAGRTFALGVLSLLIAWAPWLGVTMSAILGLRYGSIGAVSACALVMLLQATLRARAGVPIWPVLVIPLFYPLFAAVFVEAAVKSWMGGDVHWRGRSYKAEVFPHQP